MAGRTTMWVRLSGTHRAPWTLLAGTALAATVATTALGGNGIGAVFNLGQTNTVNARSILVGQSNSGMLRVVNTGTGGALELSVATPGKAPIKLNGAATGVVTHLNADRLDGFHAKELQRRVTGACAVGSTIRSINTDGTVVCEPESTLVSAIGTNTQVTTAAPGIQVPWSIAGAFTQPAGRVFYDIVGEATVVMPAACADAPMTTGSTTVTVFLDGAVPPILVGGRTKDPALAGQTVTIRLSHLGNSQFGSITRSSDVQHQLTVQVSDSCAGATEDWTWTSLTLDVIQFG